ncbi:2-dehydro-3-deoxygalactonokinase [Leucobacter sp. UCD-THU]|uniref:2-dehydro-3-deoxygalactonokinase n=1 Tax=Leucobacter sp. UCD-THU TaxID=1292023 RepID=UPI00037EA48B|nr:2-dehydro-3-deoxygalactonokinase [Leucobacter sp. UCD-THU]EYT56597.1 2-dehydro-3-deoxygalactonokinase [Leucobacter sp. UCD-THU]
MSFVGVDWGTSSLRAYLIDDTGAILDQRSGRDGISKTSGQWEQTLLRYIGDWVDTGVHDVVLSGMITSRQGWVETPYVSLPADAMRIAEEMVHRRVAGLDLWFAPGLAFERDASTVDVIRGEETQILGQLAEDSSGTSLIILPGSHSKWVLIDGGTVTWFSTFLTGELFNAIAEHTLLRTTLSDKSSKKAFVEGVTLGSASETGEGGILHKLFSLRVRALDNPNGAVSKDLLAGLILGTEIREATQQLARLPSAYVIGNSVLARQYITAMETSGLAVELGNEDAAAAGLFKLFQDRKVPSGL